MRSLPAIAVLVLLVGSTSGQASPPPVRSSATELASHRTDERAAGTPPSTRRGARRAVRRRDRRPGPALRHPRRDVVVMPAVADPGEAGCVHFAGARRGITADLTRGWVRGQGTDRLRRGHCLVGTAYADHLTDSPGPDRLAVCETSSPKVERRRNTVRAGAGTDDLLGLAGADRLDRGPGRDDGCRGPVRGPGAEVTVSVERLTPCP